MVVSTKPLGTVVADERRLTCLDGSIVHGLGQKLTLCLKATLDNITLLQPQSEQHEFHFRVQCSSCHEEHPNTVPVNQQVRPKAFGELGSAVWSPRSRRADALL